MIKTISILTLLLIICFVSYGQVRVASSTKVTDPLVYTSAQTDVLLKTTDSIYFDAKYFIVKGKVVALNADSIYRYIVKPSIDSLGKLMAIGFAASNARQDSIVKAFNGLNSAVWASNNAISKRVDTLNTTVNALALKQATDNLALTNRIVTLENTTANLNLRLSATETAIISINSSIAAIQIQIKAIKVPVGATSTSTTTTTTQLQY